LPPIKITIVEKEQKREKKSHPPTFHFTKPFPILDVCKISYRRPAKIYVTIILKFPFKLKKTRNNPIGRFFF
jgi:hypothetical protein